MTDPKSANDPSMDDILASIRKIISDDEARAQVGNQQGRSAVTPPRIGPDAARDDVLLAPNMAWPGRSITRLVTEATGLPAFLENDANAAAWAEHRYGAGAGVDDLLLVTVGTGIGGGLVLGGRLHRGDSGVAAEIGHICLVPDGRRCGCSARGCWEAYGSGSALTQGAREAIAESAPYTMLTQAIPPISQASSRAPSGRRPMPTRTTP